jgi:cytochrome c
MKIRARIVAVLLIGSSILAVPAMASDVAKGKKLFNRCKACHVLDKPKNKVGPHLVGIMGRASATVEGFKYSKAMKAANVVWDEETLDAFLAKPKSFIKRTKMAFPGLKKPAQRADIIAYMKSVGAE